MNARSVSLAAVLWTAMAMPAGAQQPHRDEPMVGATAGLEFCSDFWLNLHHVLYAAAWDRRPEKGLARAAGVSVGFETSLSPDEQRIWDGAVEVYARDVASKDLLFDSHMTDLKVVLGIAGDDLPNPAPWFPPAVRNALLAAAPIYRAHAWAADDRANRAWIGEARRRLDALAPDVSPRLASLLGTPWPTTPIRVDAVRVATRQGAYTTIDPKWIVVSTSDPHNQEWAAAEVLFHETSHLLDWPRRSGARRGGPRLARRRAP